MFYLFFFIAAAAVPILNIFYPVLKQPYTWWLIPVIVVAVFSALVVLFIFVLLISILSVNYKKTKPAVSAYFRFLIDNALKMAVPLLRVKIHTTGKELLPENVRFLLVCNHLNDIDPAVIMHEIPEAELCFVAKDEICTKLTFVARAIHKLGGLFINRDNNREAAKTIVNATKLIKEDKASVGIFPEGYTSKTGDLQDMRNGAFKIAIKAECPVVICTVCGTKEAVKHLLVKKNHIYFDVLKVLLADEVKALSTAEIGDMAHTLMSENPQKYKKG